MMLDNKQLHTLAVVVDCGGFDKAAQQLCVTQSAVSQRIRQLEDSLGQPVLLRVTPPQPTAAGRRLLQHYRQLALMESELLQTLRPDDNAQAFTTLAVGVNADSLATWFLPAIDAVLRTQRLLLDVVVDDQDHTQTLMQQGHVIGCVSTRAQAFQGGECRYLGTMRYRCLATPQYRARYFGDGLNAATLARAPAVLFSGKDDLHGEYLAQHFGFTQPFPSFTLPAPHAFVDITLAGHAYSLLPEMMVGEALASGALVDLLPAQPVDLALYWHHWRVESVLARQLADTLAACGQRWLRQDAV